MSDQPMSDRERAIRLRLSRFYTDRHIHSWFKWNHPLLGGRTARDVIDSGDIEKVERVVEQLGGGGPC